MYSYPTRFPQSSNREDLNRVISIADDDTGDYLNLSGVTVLQNPNGYLNNNWVITDGQILTSSSTPFFVPGYPIGSQLLSVALTTHDLNLGILAGDLITIADFDGDATMVGYVTSYTPTTGALVVQVSLKFQLEIRSLDQRHRRDDYSPWYDWGGGPSPDSGQPIILASLGQGLTIVDVGYLQINIPASIIQRLQLRTYMIALAMTNSVDTRQIFIGELPMLYGGIQTWPWAGAASALQTV